MSQLNPLNDLSRVYLDHVAKINQQNESDDVKRWQEGENDLQKQIKISSGIIASGGAPTMEEEKKAAKDYDGDGKVESGKDEYFGSKDKAIKKAMGKKVKEDTDNYVEAYVTELNKATMGSYVKKASKDLSDRRFDQGDSEKRKYDPDAADDKEEKKLVQREKGISRAATKLSKEGYQRNPEADPRSERQKRMDDPDTGINSSKFRAFMAAQQGGSKKVKKESLSNWRDDLSDLIEVAPMTDVEAEKVVKEKKVNNKVTINPKMSEAVAQIGGELIAEKEVDVKDTRRTVDAIRAYDRSKDASRDATYDTDKGNKKKGDKEKKYAAKERGEIKKDDPNWKKRKYHTGMHGEETEVVEGYGKKKKKGHDCASKVKHEEYGIGFCIKGQHTILEDGTVGHYDVEFEEYIVENCPVEELEILVSEMHMHKEMKEGVVSKEVKALQKAGKTLKDTPVVKADKIDTANYKGQKFGVKEDDDWIQKAVKRPGAFTRKAKAAGMGVQQFAKSVDANPGKYSTRTKKQANLAQTFASMKKEDVEELFYTLIAE